MEKTIIFSILALAMSLPAMSFARSGSHVVRQYTTKNGVYVPTHHATNRDSTKSNNWSQNGNVNPYTGKEGTKN